MGVASHHPQFFLALRLAVAAAFWALKEEYAWAMAALLPAAFVQHPKEKPEPQALSQVQILAVALVYLFQEPWPARRALVKLWPAEMYPVCPEESLLQAA